jgi:hypothetical protein
MAQLKFQFSTANTVIDWIIRTRTDSDISHVDVVLPDGRLLGAQLLEPARSGGRGVQIRQPKYAAFTKTSTVTLEVSELQAKTFWDFVLAQVGQPYDIYAILGLAFHRDWRDPNHWFCSELQAAGAEAAKILNIATDVNWIDPQTLLLLFCASRYFVSKVDWNQEK